INAGIVATIMFVSKILDAFSDILMGAIQEKFAKPGAKARPWIIKGFIPYAISAILLFSVPDFSSTIKTIIYIFITYNLFCTVFYTMMSIPFFSLGSLITQNQKEREMIGVLRSIFTTIVSTIVNSFTMTFISWAGGTKTSWTIVIAIFALISTIAFFFAYKNTKERVIIDDTNTEKSKNAAHLTLSQNMKLLFQNKYWLILTLNAILTNMTIAANSGSLFFYLKNVIGHPEAIAICGMLLSMPMIVLIPLSKPLVARFGKRNMLAAGTLVMGLSRLFVWLVGSNLNLIFLGTFIFSIGCATAWTAAPMLWDTVEYGEWKTGVRQDGFIMSAQSFGQKVGTAIGTALVGWILAWFGYNGAAESQSHTAIIGITIDYIWLTVIFSALAVILLFAFYHLDSEYPKIVKELQERKACAKEIK
ncbi:MAG: glycoside-pentoside-hexuronide (GPH):cation symporter, partial [Treponema sp.]|nr:glycoside-pentoside-hexuronide (GPH):cation symporter [Treponema sp.]